MHHKRRRPKNRRAGCLMCKPHKANGAKKKKHSDKKKMAQEEIRVERSSLAHSLDWSLEGLITGEDLEEIAREAMKPRKSGKEPKG